MTDKKTRATKQASNRPSSSPSSTDKTRSASGRKRKPERDLGATAERGEAEPLTRPIGDQGDLDDETLDRDAPYNKTYGRE